jgi:hypothetical protein
MGLHHVRVEEDQLLLFVMRSNKEEGFPWLAS